MRVIKFQPHLRPYSHTGKDKAEQSTQNNILS